MYMQLTWELSALTNPLDANSSEYVNSPSVIADLYKVTNNGTMLLPELEAIPESATLANRAIKIGISRVTLKNSDWFANTEKGFTELK